MYTEVWDVKRYHCLFIKGLHHFNGIIHSVVLEERCHFSQSEEKTDNILKENVFYDFGNYNPYGLLGLSAVGISFLLTMCPLPKAILGQTTLSSKSSLSTYNYSDEDVVTSTGAESDSQTVRAQFLCRVFER